MKKRVKKVMVLGMVVAMMASSTLCVSAKGLKDVFNAKYYADSYADLKAAFGDNEEALYSHFINYGLAENRKMSPVIDVQAYRAAYPDLNAAFGDNWDAYVEHFFAYGMREGRAEGILFNPLVYAAAYPDVAAAYGSDIVAITAHYINYGIAEGRTAGVTVKAPETKQSGGSGSSSGSSSGNTGSSTPSTPEDPEKDLPTIKVYKEVSYAGGKITGLGTATEVEMTAGEGTSSAPYTAEVSGVKKVPAEGGTYWFAIALPCEDTENMHYWLKIGDTWTDVTTNVTTVDSIPGDHMVYAVGDNGSGGDVELCMSAEDTEPTEGTFYRINVTFEGSGVTPPEEDEKEEVKHAVWAPLVDRAESTDLNGEEGALTKINEEMENGVTTTVDSEDNTLAVVTFDTMTNSIPKHKNTEEEGYWFGIGVPYKGDGYTYCWGLATNKEAAQTEVAKTELKEEPATNTYGDCATFYWGFLNASQDHTSKCGYLVVKQGGDVVAKYVVDFGGLRFKTEQQGSGN